MMTPKLMCCNMSCHFIKDITKGHNRDFPCFFTLVGILHSIIQVIRQLYSNMHADDVYCFFVTSLENNMHEN